MITEEISDYLFGEIKKYPKDFFVLGLLLAFSIVAFLHFSYAVVLQKRMIYFAGASYLFWGIVHHWHKKDLSLKVILEYLLFSIFGVLMGVFVLLRV